MICYIKPSLLGDTILVEPALTAWSIANGQSAKLCIDPEIRQYECLFHYNTHIEIIPYQDKNTREEQVIVPDTSAAFWHANGNNLPFSGGYFPQFGLTPDPAKDRLHFKLFGSLESIPDYTYSCICPNARSCASAADPGQPPSIMASRDWWDRIIQHMTSKCCPTFDLGSNEDMEIDNTIPFHGHDFRKVAGRLAKARFAISVETGLLHLAGGIDGLPIIFLSSATPPFFSAPKGARVVRARTPGRTDFDHDEVIKHIDDILKS